MGKLLVFVRSHPVLKVVGDVAEIPDACLVLIGQLALEGLDFIVDPVNQRLVGAHGAERMIELY
ncbi:MAG: hypothetical protein U0793_28200 [Gemmataceae bacterium]